MREKMEKSDFIKSLEIQILKLLDKNNNLISIKFQKPFQKYIKFISLYTAIEPTLDFLSISHYHDLFDFAFKNLDIDKNKKNSTKIDKNKKNHIESLLTFFSTLYKHEFSDLGEFIDKKFINKLIKILGLKEEEDLIKYTLIIVTNITHSEDPKFCDIFLETDLLFFLSNFLKNGDSLMMEYVLDVVVNLVLDDCRIKDFIMQKEIFFFELLSILEKEDFSCFRPILKVFRNFFNLVNLKTGIFLCDNLVILKQILNLLSKRIIFKVAMDIHKIFQKCLLLGECLVENGVFKKNFVVEEIKKDEKICDKLCLIQQHSDNHVYEMFKETIEEYDFK